MRSPVGPSPQLFGLLISLVVAGSMGFPMVATPSSAQEPEELSDTISVPLTGPPEVTIQVASGRRYVVVADFALPLATYSLSEVLSRTPTSELNFPTSFSACPLNQAALDIIAAETEDDVRPRAQRLARLLAGLVGGSEPSCDEPEIRRARAVLVATKREWIIGPYERGAQVSVTLSRAPVADQTQARAWELKLLTPSRGSWTTSFGFGLLYQNWSRPDDYYIQDTDGGRVAVKAGPRQSLSFAPSLVFSYDEPGEGHDGFEWRKVAGGFGLGPVDLSNPFIFLGTGVAYRENIGLYVGVAAQGVRKIRPQYAGSGDSPAQVPTGITEDQLYTSRVGVNPYFLVSFRFGSNPFTSADPPKPEAIEKPQGDGGVAPSGSVDPP